MGTGDALQTEVSRRLSGEMLLNWDPQERSGQARHQSYRLLEWAVDVTGGTHCCLWQRAWEQRSDDDWGWWCREELGLFLTCAVSRASERLKWRYLEGKLGSNTYQTEEDRSAELCLRLGCRGIPRRVVGDAFGGLGITLREVKATESFEQMDPFLWLPHQNEGIKGTGSRIDIVGNT